MQVTSTDNKDYAVLDGVLEGNMFKEFHSFFHNDLDFAYRALTGWQKVWKISDGLILSGPPFYNSKSPHNNMMDTIGQIVSALAEQHFSNIVGKKGVDWDDFFMTPYIYPMGTKISWHNDYSYSGAAIFYSHNFWGNGWGGELFLAKTRREYPSVEDSEKDKFSNSILKNRVGLNSFLNEVGMGTYISPLPNRMVLTRGSVWHSINRVDPSAGDAMRSSVVAFFVKKEGNS